MDVNLDLLCGFKIEEQEVISITLGLAFYLLEFLNLCSWLLPGEYTPFLNFLTLRLAMQNWGLGINGRGKGIK